MPQERRSETRVIAAGPGPESRASLRALDWLNFFLADVQSGLGPFLAIFLITAQHWNAADIGIVMTIAGIATLIAQAPAGALIDATKHKRLAIMLAAGIISVAALVVTFAPTFTLVVGAQVLLGGAAAIFPPATAAIALGLVGPRLFTHRMGRMQSFNHAGNVVAAVVAGALGYFISTAAVFWVVSALGILAIGATFFIDPRRIDHQLARGFKPSEDKGADSLQPVGDCGGEADAGHEVGGLLIVASCDSAPILEPIEGALDDVSHLVGDGVVRFWLFAIGLGRYDGFAAICSQVVSDVVCIIGFVAEKARGCGDARQQATSTPDIVNLAARQHQGVEPAELVAQRMDFGGGTAARAADRLFLRPPFAPAADRCARTAVLSTMASSGGSAHPARAAKSCCHSPRWLQRLNRLNTVVRGPYTSGSARQRKPSRKRCRIPLMIRRSSTRGLPPQCGNNGSIAAHCTSFSQNNSAMIQALLGTLNQMPRGRRNGYTPWYGVSSRD